MKSLFAALAGTAFLALAGPVHAQMIYAPVETAPPPPAPYYPALYYPAPYYQVAAPAWQMDDGSSSDFPVHMPGDVSGDQLNAQYRDGIDVPPPNGFPAPYYR